MGSKGKDITQSPKLIVTEGELLEGVVIYYRLNEDRKAELLLQFEENEMEIVPLEPSPTFWGGVSATWASIAEIQIIAFSGKVYVIMKETEEELMGKITRRREFFHLVLD
jgi:hypothetical protein